MQISLIPDKIQKLIEAHRKLLERFNFVKSLKNISVSKVASLAGGTYEIVRNSVELEQDHLLRRRAISRILIRQKALNGGNPSDIAEDLIKEVIWAKYMKGYPVPELAIEQIGKVIEKYHSFVTEYENKFHNRPSKARLIDLYDILSFEIERIFIPYYVQDSLTAIQYTNLKDLGLTKSDKLPSKYEAIQTYIAVLRTLHKFDDAMIKYYMFSNAFPFWENITPSDMKTVLIRFDQTLEEIDSHIKFKLGNRKLKEFTKFAIPLKILNQTIQTNLDEAENMLASKETRDEHVRATCKREYDQISKKVRSTIIKTLIYLVATKMLFAVMVEVPYELWRYSEIHYHTLAINVLFPPALMAIIASSFKIPKARNTTAIIEMIDRLMNPSPNNFVKDGISRVRKRPIMHFVFKLMSNFIFFGVIAAITFVLRTYLGFNVVSIGVFLLFLCLISFGALKTRNVATELIVVPIRGSIFTPLIDTIATPILNVGKNLTEGVSAFSPLPFIFDKIFEAPFKGFLMFFEEWNSYIKEQREEIV